MTMFIGTSHFISKAKAISYFKTQECDKETVNQYLKEGLIHIGKPSGLPNQDFIIDDTGRYFIKESLLK